MIDALYFSALALGFLGSFHCAGMCGPIALMLPKSEGSLSKMITGRLIYNSGRVFTYIIIGLFFGLVGLAVAMKGFQRELSVITGVIIIITVLSGLGSNYRIEAFRSTPAISNFIRKQLKKLFAKKTFLSLFLIGVLNGLLPCGFVYLAVAGAASTGSVTGGAIYMSLFGLGTFPIMMMLSVAANYFGIRFRNIFKKLSPGIAIVLAIFLIYRGTVMNTRTCCHQTKQCAVYTVK